MEEELKHAREDYQGRIVDTAGLIPEDEPVFLLRAKDKNFVAMLRYYERLLREDPKIELNMVAAVEAHIIEATIWQGQNPPKTPDMPGRED